MPVVAEDEAVAGEGEQQPGDDQAAHDRAGDDMVGVAGLLAEDGRGLKALVCEDADDHAKGKALHRDAVQPELRAVDDVRGVREDDAEQEHHHRDGQGLEGEHHHDGQLDFLVGEEGGEHGTEHAEAGENRFAHRRAE